MLDSLYERQTPLQLEIPGSVAVIGVGGVGYWVAKDLALSGVPKLYLFDPDTVEIHNLNRLDMTPDAVGKAKVQVMEAIIRSIRPLCSVGIFAIRAVPDDVLMLAPEVVIDCTDNRPSQILFSRACPKAGIRYIRAGYNGTHMTVTGGVSEWGEGGPGGYTVVPSWVVPAQIAAALAIAKAEKYPDLDFGGEVCQIGTTQTAPHK